MYIMNACASYENVSFAYLHVTCVRTDIVRTCVCVQCSSADVRWKESKRASDYLLLSPWGEAVGLPGTLFPPGAAGEHRAHGEPSPRTSASPPGALVLRAGAVGGLWVIHRSPAATGGAGPPAGGGLPSPGARRTRTAYGRTVLLCGHADVEKRYLPLSPV